MPFDGTPPRRDASLLPSAVLAAARARIECFDNWCQGIVSDSEGRLCAVGALLLSSSAARRGAQAGHLEWDAQEVGGQPFTNYFRAVHYLDGVAARYGYSNFVQLNDRITIASGRRHHQFVLWCMAEAIAEARAAGE